MMRRFLITAVCTLLAFPVMAQEDALKDLPGYVDFGELDSIYGEARVNISIGGALLIFVARMMEEDDPETAELFNKLKGVRVSVYSTEELGADAALDQVNRVKSTLQSSSWQPIVQVNDDGEQVQIFMKMDGDKMNGLTLMAVDDEEAVFINVIGQLDPHELSQVMDNFDIDINDAMDIDLD
jgi:hypothetical protein